MPPIMDVRPRVILMLIPMNNAPDKIADPATNPAPVRELVPGSTGNAENPYPWFRPMPVVWVCVIICIVLIVVGSLMNKAS